MKSDIERAEEESKSYRILNFIFAIWKECYHFETNKEEFSRVYLKHKLMFRKLE